MTQDALIAQPVTSAPPAGYPPAYDAREEFSIAGVLAVLRRRRREIVLVGVGVALLTAIALLLQPRDYEATATLLIDPRQQRVVAPEQSLTVQTPDATFIDSEVEVLNSQGLATDLVTRLRLRADPEFNPAAARVNEASRAEALKPPREGERDPVVNRVNDALEARRKGDTNVIEITARADTAEKASRLANGLAQAYFAANRTLAASSVADADAWLQQRLEELRAQVNQKEAAADAFRAEAGLVMAQGSTLTEQQITEAQASVLAARNDLAEAEARYAQVRDLIARGASPDDIADVISSSTIRDLRGREADVARRRAELLTRYGELHPAVQNNAAELGDIRAQIASETRRIAGSIASEVKVARAKLASLETHLGQTQTEMYAGNNKMVTLRELEREAAAARTVYESFLERSHELSEQGGLSPVSARLLSAATPPANDTAPSFLIVLLISTALGLAAGVIAALVIEQVDDRLSTADDVERRAGVPALASIPSMPKRMLAALPLDRRHPAHYLVQNPLSSFAEAMRVVRASLLFTPSETPRKIVAITSALPGEGKTTLALCLARIAALSGERVILVDCDVRRRSINDILNIAPRAGLLEVLSGAEDWRRVIGRDEETPAHVLPLSTSAIPLDDRIGSGQMKRLVRQLAQEYDFVILDCAPVLAVADTRALAALADTVVLVGRAGRTTAQAMCTAIAQLRATGARLGGVALNAVDPRSPGRSSYSDALYYTEAQKAYYTTA